MNCKKYEFDIDIFNNVFWHIKEAFNDLKIRFIWIYGGSSASKTFSVVQCIIIEMLSNNDSNTLVLRKYATDIRDSIFSDFKNVINDWGLSDVFIIQQNFIKCNTGSYIRFRGLDDSEKIKGISNFQRVVLEEVNQFDEIDLKQIRKRLRGRENQQIIGIFNPISEDHWIKQNIFDKEILTEVDSDITGKWINAEQNLLILKTNYLDNVFIVGRFKDGIQTGGFIDIHTIADFEKDKIIDYAYYEIYGLGNWGKIRTGGEFWKDFNPNNHIKKVQWNEALPISLSWDENVNPYLTCLVWQLDGKKAIQIDEICLEDPRNRVKHVCAEFRKRYPHERVKGLFLYGDRTSWKEDTKKEKGENFFTDIVAQLADYKPQLRLQSVNPSVVQSGSFINEIYARNEGGLEIIIGVNCKKSTNDYQYALEDSDGTLKKTKKTHPVTKVSYEEFGHPSDAKRYLITTAFNLEYQNYLRGGKSAFIRTGKSIRKNNY
jgi:phage terminase large subunit